MIVRSIIALFLLLNWSVIDAQVEYALPDQNDFKYTPRFWTTSQGLPQNSINVILQDHKNYIWCFTNEGITKFDGVEFKIFNNNNTDGLEANRFEDGAMGSDGVMWVVSSDGYLVSIRDDDFQSFALPRVYQYPVGVQIDTLDRPIIAFDDKVYLFENGQFSLLLGEEYFTNDRIHDIVFNVQSGQFLLSTDRGILLHEDDSLQELFHSQVGEYVYFIENLRHDSILFNYANDYFVMEGKALIDTFSITSASRSNELCAYIDSKKNKWIAVSQGLKYISPSGKTVLLTEEDGISSSSIKEIFEDVNGNIWLGSSDHGLTLLTPKLFTKLQMPDPFQNRSINAICPQGDSLIWVIQNCMGVLQANYDKGKVYHYSTKLSDRSLALGSDCAWTVFQDSKDNIWIGGYGGGINCYTPNGEGYHFTPDEYDMQKSNFSFLQLSEEQLLIGSNKGVYLFDYKSRSFRSLNEEYNFPPVPVNHMLRDQKGRLWFCTTRGILKWENDSLTHYSKDAGSFPINTFRYTFEDDEGHLWFGSYGEGMFYYKDDSFYTTDITEASYSNVVSWIQKYDDKIWITTNNGLFAVDHQQLIRSVHDPSIQLDVLSFGEVDGLDNDEFNGGFQNTGFIQEGKFYLPSVRGVVIFDPGMVPSQDPSPVDISTMEVDGVVRESDNDVHYDHKRIRFGISTPIFSNRQNYKLEYQLQGFDDDWIPLSDKKQEIEFTRLSSGDYTLRVRSRSLLNGNISEASFPFSIATPYWLQPMFYVWVIVSLIILVVLVYRILLQRRKMRERELESQVKQRTQELSLSRSNVSAIIENTDDLVWSVNREGEIIYANQNFVDFYKENTGYTITTGDNVFKHLDIPNQLYWKRMFEKALEGKKFSVRRNLGEWENGEAFSVSHINLNPIINASGEVSGVVVYTTDITQTLKQQKELEKAKQEALSAAKSKSEFLATMSHEIRTPMNGVIGMTSLLMKTPLSEEQKDYVKTIRVSGDSLLTIINDILDFSKIDSGRMELEMQPLRVEKIIHETFDLLAKDALDKGLELVYSIDESVPDIIDGDVTRLRQILINLVNNAIKFTEKGLIKIKLDTLSNKVDKFIQFSIVDTGVGMDEEKLNKIFQPFSQGDSSTTRKFGGTGLGLAICKKLVRLMNGEINAFSTPGKGSTFVFTIQYQQDWQAESSQHATMQTLKDTSLHLCMSNEAAASFIADELRNKGFAASYSCSIEEVKQKLRKDNQLDILIIDEDTLSIEDYGQIKKSYAGLSVFILVRQDQKAVARKKYVSADLIQKPIIYSELIRKVYDQLHQIEESEEDVIFESNDINLASRFPLTILLVEDGKINQKLALLYLKKLGYSADLVENGQEALEAVHDKEYDLVFMDIQMPIMDGYEATHRIQELKGENAPVIIAMTANAMKGDREKVLKNGMQDYISKPVLLKTFKALLIKWGRKIRI